MGELTNKQKVFIEEYLTCWNATEAARRAGYQGSDSTLGVVGFENIRKPKIARRISNRLAAKAMTADEVLMRLAEQARADIGEFVGEQGQINWEAVKEKGHLIKKITHTKGKHSQIELYDGQAALIQIGKHHSLFVEKHQLDTSVTIIYKGNIDPTEAL